MIQRFKDIEEFDEYLIEYLEKSGINFYQYFIKTKFFDRNQMNITVIYNIISNSVKNSISKK